MSGLDGEPDDLGPALATVPALVADLQKVWSLPDGSALYRIGRRPANPAP